MRLAILFLIPVLCWGATVPATSCSQAHVEAAIVTAVDDDTVTVPGGTCTWSTTVLITEGLTIDGGGATISGPATKTTPTIEFRTTADYKTRITNFAFDTNYAIRLEIGGSSHATYRIDHNDFDVTSGVVMDVEDYGPGLIDHNTFDWSGTSSEIIHQLGGDYNDASGWSVDVNRGSAEAVYIENNIFTYTGSGNFGGVSAVQNYYGARTVFRSNVLDTNQVDVHGTGGYVGGRWYEFYNNVFHTNTTSTIQCCFFSIRAGSGFIFQNEKMEGSYTGAGNQNIWLREEDSGYPALYQVGRGKDQVLEPAYAFSNDAGWNTESATANVLVNRDFYTDYGISSFDGTVGAWSGLAADRPATCTTGVGYWVTDEGEWNSRHNGSDGRFYKCTSTNTWTLWYTPYTYPHPDATRANTVLADCAAATVQAALDVAFPGDTIVCPAGSWTWTGTGAVEIQNRQVTLQGNGIDSTTITLASAGALNVPAANEWNFQLTGFTFRSTGNFGTDSGLAMITLRGGRQWRIHGNKFKIYSNVLSYAGGNAIYTVGVVDGLIDNNSFENESTSTNCWHAATYIEGQGTAAWALGSKIAGQPDVVFIEDNTFTETRSCADHNPHAAYGQNGGIYVLRYNTITNANADSHGFCGSYATREYEISNNQWVVSDARNIYALMFIRGGTGRIYSNDLNLEGSGTATYGLRLTEYRVNSPSSCGAITQDTYNANACCNTEEGGYPCTSQIGRGLDQALDPLYIWSNTDFPANLLSNMGSSCSGADISTYLQADRDYYLSDPTYIGYTYPHPLQGADVVSAHVATGAAVVSGGVSIP